MKKILLNTLSVLSKKEKKQFLNLSLLDILINIADIVSLALLVWIIQFYIRSEAVTPAFLPAWLVDRQSLTLVGIFVILFSLKNLSAYFIAKAQFNFISKVAVRLSKNKLENYLHGSFDEFINIDSSVHIRRICFQPFEFCQYVLAGIQQVLTQSVLIFASIAAILWFDAYLFLLLLLILLPPVIVVFFFIKKKLAKMRSEIRSSNEKSFQSVSDALKGYVESNIYGRNDFFLQRFTRHRGQFSTQLFNSISLQNLPPRIIEIVAVLGLFALIALSGFTSTDLLLSIGAFMAAAYKIIPGVVKIINIGGQVKAYESVITDLDKSETEIENPSPGLPIESIQFKNVNFCYDKQPLLRNLNVCLQKGDFTGITGLSGKGKTTILNILLGFLSPCDGQVLINDKIKNKEQLREYWPSIAYIRQQSFFIYDDILRNITLSESKYDHQRLQNALKISGLDALAAASGEGLQKIITENGKNISGGQQQRVSLARALYKQADVILLDEPFNELDDTSEAKLLEHFRELSQTGKLIILITHDKRNLSYCNKIISLDEP